MLVRINLVLEEMGIAFKNGDTHRFGTFFATAELPKNQEDRILPETAKALSDKIDNKQGFSKIKELLVLRNPD